jgi:tRNA(adenine34) deaminase
MKRRDAIDSTHRLQPERRVAASGDVEHMKVCLREAKRAGEEGEVPVGAVVVVDGRIVSRGRNASIRLHDPTAHAEIVALRAAAKAIGNYRMPTAELVVTVEPCLMCVGAILQARVKRVVYGCDDSKAGALGSIADYSDDPRLNHRFRVEKGVCEDAARALLQGFFRKRRKRGGKSQP